MKKLFFILIIFLFIFTQQVCAIEENIKKISLKEAIDITLKNNPQNQMAKLDVDIAKKEVKIANKLNNPTVYYSHNFGKAGESNANEFGAKYQIPLFKRMYLKKLAKTNIDVAENTQKYKENELIYNVKVAYFELLRAKTIFEIMQEQKNNSKSILDNAINESKKGKIAETDVILAKIEYNSSIMDCNEAKFQVISARNKLNSVMNSTANEFDTSNDYLSENYQDLLTINPTNKEFNFDDIKNYTFSHRHDLLSAQAEVKSAINKLEVIKSQLIPDMELKGGWLYTPKHANESGKLENGAIIEANIVNIPLVYQYKPEIQKAKLEIEKAELKYKDTKIDITRHLTETWEKYIIAKENLIFYNKELLSNSLELAEVSTKNLKKNKISMAEYLVAKQKYTNMMINYNEALAEYYLSYALLLKEIDISDLNLIKKESL